MRIAPSSCPFLSLRGTFSIPLFLSSFSFFFEIVSLLLFVRSSSTSCTLSIPSSLVSSRSVPDLFFFCLNLVAIRGGHTPRQGRVCTRASIGWPRSSTRQQADVHMRLHVRKGNRDACMHAYSMVFCRDAVPRRGSRSTGADLCLVIRKLLRSRDFSLTITRNFSGWSRATDVSSNFVRRLRLLRRPA